MTRSQFHAQQISRDRLFAAFPNCKELNDEDLERILRRLALVSLPAKQLLLLENDFGNCVYFILSGWIKIRTFDLEGKEVLLNLIGKGEIFGEMSVLDDVERSTDAVAKTQVLIGRLPGDDFQYLVDRSPQFCKFVIRLINKRLRIANRRLQFRDASATCRVADILLFLAQTDISTAKNRSTLDLENIGHNDIASLSGLRRETVSRTLTKLKKKGIAATGKNSIVIYDLEKLKNLTYM